MLSRKWAAPTLLAATVAIPYGASNAGWLQQLRGTSSPLAATPKPPSFNFPTSPAAAPGATNPALVASPPGPNAALFPTRTPLEGVQSYSLADVLRLDVSKEWVYQRWPRKSTALSELDRFGVRVPLVSGTKLDDLAGSLTYFFDGNGRVQRLSFRGHTGDTTQVVAIVTQRFGLQRQATAVVGEQLFQLGDGENVISQLRTRPAPVLWASSPHDSFSVELDLQDPAAARPLKSPAPAMPAAATLPPAAPAAAPASPTVPPGTSPPPVANAAPAAATSSPPPSGWDALFPRSRVPKPQLENLEHFGAAQ
jgi:hypothetical protein